MSDLTQQDAATLVALILLVWAFSVLPLWRKTRELLDKTQELKRRNTLWRSCYGEPSDDEIATLVRDQVEEDRLHLLKHGQMLVHAMSNCAPGTWVYMIHCMAAEGLLERRPTADHMQTLYVITAKGRAYLQGVKA